MKNPGGQRSPRVRRAVRIGKSLAAEYLDPKQPLSPWGGEWSLPELDKWLGDLIREFPNCAPVREAKAQIEAAISIRALRLAGVSAPNKSEEWPALFGRGASYVP